MLLQVPLSLGWAVAQPACHMRVVQAGMTHAEALVPFRKATPAARAGEMPYSFRNWLYVYAAGVGANVSSTTTSTCMRGIMHFVTRRAAGTAYPVQWPVHWYTSGNGYAEPCNGR